MPPGVGRLRLRREVERLHQMPERLADRQTLWQSRVAEQLWIRRGQPVGHGGEVAGIQARLLAGAVEERGLAAVAQQRVELQVGRGRSGALEVEQGGDAAGNRRRTAAS